MPRQSVCLSSLTQETVYMECRQCAGCNIEMMERTSRERERGDYPRRTVQRDAKTRRRIQRANERDSKEREKEREITREA